MGIYEKTLQTEIQSPIFTEISPEDPFMMWRLKREFNLSAFWRLQNLLNELKRITTPLTGTGYSQLNDAINNLLIDCDDKLLPIVDVVIIFINDNEYTFYRRETKKILNSLPDGAQKDAMTQNLSAISMNTLQSYYQEYSILANMEGDPFSKFNFLDFEPK